MTKEDIIAGVLKEFEGLAGHPRPSHHEKEVSDYIVGRLAELGVTARQDDVYNIIADVPATPGYENAPVTVLQGHMDMVCVSKPGVVYDPVKDPIKLVREGNILRADGTSLVLMTALPLPFRSISFSRKSSTARCALFLRLMKKRI